MQTWADEQLAMLRANYPVWDVWLVPRYPTGQTWCARPAGHAVAVINASSPEELVKAIAEYERG